MAAPYGQNPTPKKDVAIPKFLAMYRRCGIVKAACAAAGISRETYRQWRAHDPAFAAAVADAAEDATEELEEIGRQRARESSDVLLIFFLKALRPERYRDRHLVEVLQRYEAMTDDELNEHLARRLGEAAALGEGGAALPAGEDGAADDDGGLIALPE